ncbi:MAG TPA: RsmB/NOP family class I SAM-dependent RNA methyltransferase, partial [Verrucomicrobiae bacterium]|nr:RsmB/NOP family class I SAM-dependent RNA methyltransferase [Verrucomicrobiae bacterium]
RLKRGGFPVSVSPISSMGLVFKERAAVFNLEEFTEGLFEVQDAGSQKVCEAVGARPGDAVWDVCAGSGGKSLSLAAMMQNKGRIVATDIRKHKLDDLKKRASRAGVYNIFPADLDRMDEMKLAKKGFDKILVDAPCSGTGTLKRNPDAKWKLSPEEFGKYQEDQLKIIKNSLRYLKKGGRLYYVTCSIEEVENEGVMDRLMKEEAGLVPVVDIEFGEASGPWRRLWPAHENDGFFLGVVEKI